MTVCCESRYYSTIPASEDNTVLVTICWDDMLLPNEIVESVTWESSGEVTIVQLEPNQPSPTETTAMVTGSAPGDRVAATVVTSLNQIDRRTILFVKGW